MDPDGLEEMLGQQLVSSIRNQLEMRNRRIFAAVPRWYAKGHTDAHLVGVVLEVKDPETTGYIRCLAKVFPPGTDRGVIAGHQRSLDGSPKDFIEKHLVQMVFDPIECGDGTVVVGQDIAGGSLLRCVALSEIDEEEALAAFRVVTSTLINEWVGDDHRSEVAESWPQLLNRALGKTIESGGWLLTWAESVGLTDQSAAWLDFEGAETLPNPLIYALGMATHDGRPIQYLTGRSHGDLHGGNVLIPKDRGRTLRPEKFRLIDLATFERFTLASCDPAMLFMSLLCRHVTAEETRRAVLDYLLEGEVSAKRRLPPWLAECVDAYWGVPVPNGAAGWLDPWEEQLGVSLAAAALWHATFDTFDSGVRWWCLRLASKLAEHNMAGLVAPARPLRISRSQIFQDDNATVRAAEERFLNQKAAVSKLREALVTSDERVVVVHGAPGIGKSELINYVLYSEGKAVAAEKVFEHVVTPESRLPVATLATDLEQVVTGGPTGTQRGPALARLEAAVTALGDTPVTIIIDSAQLLFADAGGRIPELDLNEAIDLLLTMPEHRVTLVLVMRTLPAVPADAGWLSKARKIEVVGLPPDCFRSYLLRRDYLPGGLGTLPDDELTTLHSLLGGNPRLAEIATALVTDPSRSVTIRILVECLAAMPDDEIPQRLFQMLVDGLHPEIKRVLRGLLAFGIPVETAWLAELLADGTVGTKLEKLHVSGVIRRNDRRRYYLPDPEVVDVVWAEDTEEARLRMSLDAADILSNQRKNDADIERLGDLDIHFAELTARIAAEEYPSALELLEAVDKILQGWDCAALLLPQRKKLATNLGNDFYEMMNYNALGHVYVSHGLLDDAKEAFDRAMEHEPASGESVGRRKIYCNKATMHWARNETKLAIQDYRSALGMAEEFYDHEDTVAAQEGLANCHRRWGQYREAVQRAESALATARSIDSSRAVRILLKLARWQNELDPFGPADRLVDEATEAARKHGDPLLYAACLDAMADLRLDRRFDSSVVRTAMEAKRIALDNYDPVILLQARTTLCMAYMRMDEVDKAAREIVAADRYRRQGGSLVVLALRAIVAEHTAAPNDVEPVSSHELFEKLRREATLRRTMDTRDFGAWDLEGLAICGIRMHENPPLDEAVRAFRKARSLTPPTLGLIRRLLSMIDLLERRCPPQRFHSVIDAIMSTEPAGGALAASGQPPSGD